MSGPPLRDQTGAIANSGGSPTKPWWVDHTKLQTIRVNPSLLRQAAGEISRLAQELRSAGDRARQATQHAPGYDGQFGPPVASIGSEAVARVQAEAARLTEASAWLLARAEAFEAADAQSQQGLRSQLSGWIHSERSMELPWIFSAPLIQWLLGDEIPQGVEDPNDPWWKQLVLEFAKAWNWYHQNINQGIYDSVDAWRGIDENARKIAQFYLAQLWFLYDKTVNRAIYESAETWKGNTSNARTIVLMSLARLWFGYDRAVNQRINWAVDVLPERAENLDRTQGPGPDPNGPIGPSLARLSETDASGNPVSQVGSELATMIEARGVSVTFLDVGFGAVPLEGRVVLPEYLADAAPSDPGFVAHELTHVLERDLNDAAYWPSGGLSVEGARFPIPLGDSTNYMEVVSNIVGLTVEYDVRFADDPKDPGLAGILDNLATYADADALNATRFLIRESWDVNNAEANAIYRANYAHEFTVADHRIPAGGWDSWLKQMGFSDAAVQHIQALASQGTAEYVDPVSLDPTSGLPVTATPTATATPTSTPTPTALPTSTPTLTPTPTPTPLSTPSPSPISSPTPSATPSAPPATPTPNP